MGVLYGVLYGVFFGGGGRVPIIEHRKKPARCLLVQRLADLKPELGGGESSPSSPEQPPCPVPHVHNLQLKPNQKFTCNKRHTAFFFLCQRLNHPVYIFSDHSLINFLRGRSLLTLRLLHLETVWDSPGDVITFEYH